jgi:hypothetical protein
VTLDRSAGTFPSGRRLLPARPSAQGGRRCSLLGAYPIALHIRWIPPSPDVEPAWALAIDNEPEPFWEGQDGLDRIGRWRAARPHRGLELRAPESSGNLDPVETLPEIQRRDLLGGLIREYHALAA